MARKDILLNEDGTFKVKNGDFVVGASDGQHISHLIYGNKGDYRESPALCMGIHNFVNSSDANKQKFVSEMKNALESDGYKISTLDVSKGLANFELDVEIP